MSGVQKRIVSDDDDQIRADRWFKRHFPELKFGQLAKLFRTGQIRLNGMRVKPSDKIYAGQEFRIPPLGEAQMMSNKPRDKGDEISREDRDYVRSLVIYEDDRMIALNKPPGLPVQGGTGLSRHLDGLLAGLVGKDKPKPKLVHRLDKDTSGVLVVAKTPKSAAELAEAFQKRTTVKIYWALLIGFPRVERGEINLKMDKLPGADGERMIESPTGKPSKTLFERVDHAGRQATWMALRPITGRTHQLRLHMATLGTPIVGDGKYGGKEAFLTGAVSKKLHLHARSIRVPLSASHHIEIVAPLPAHMQETWDMLNFDIEQAELTQLGIAE